MTESPVSVRTTVRTWLALMALALLSFLLSYVPLGGLSTPLALLIAGIKALLVVVFFMELGGQSLGNRLVCVVGVVWVLLLLSLVATDVVTRGPETVQAAPAAL